MWRLAVFSREVHRLEGSIAAKFVRNVCGSWSVCSLGVCVWAQKKNKARKSLIVTKTSIPAPGKRDEKVKVKILKGSFAREFAKLVKRCRNCSDLRQRLYK